MAAAERRRRFIDAVLKNPKNLTAAAVEAGYNPRSAAQQANALMKRDDVKTALATRTAKAVALIDSSVERITRELAAIGFADLRQVMDDTGKLLPPGAWPPEIAVCIASVETSRREVKSGIRKVKDPDEGEDCLVDETEWEVITKIKLWPKVEALKLLAVYRKMIGGGDIIPPDQRQTFVGLAVTVAPGANVQINVGGKNDGS